MAAKSKPDDDKPNNISVCRNRRARHEYELMDQLDCGIVLMGSEVKSIRAGKVSIEEAWVRVQDGELYLVGCDINEYPQASWLNHETKRTRKLLAHRRELKKFCGRTSERSITIVPLEMYLQRGFVKIKIALAKGRKLHDKREKLKAQDARREIRQVTRRG
ncbi:SsrA-binding protein [Planctopirus ephydatiae]|jgi:SsrA-binding protein|uniref:SsrA-binding protein n=1 Tax=Planctopirus ephydatiae TaxID=2528019 RepID=A0A518GJR3_9PLAN|nr:SsrA-binding protein SmpB [Planctopirus ephydatiae]QDV28843.1 SsrA-binding protein [Planctopirus ephydatiae]